MICQCLALIRLRQIIDLLATDKSRYFTQPRPIIVNYPRVPYKNSRKFQGVKQDKIAWDRDLGTGMHNRGQQRPDKQELHPLRFLTVFSSSPIFIFLYCRQRKYISKNSKQATTASRTSPGFFFNNSCKQSRQETQSTLQRPRSQEFSFRQSQAKVVFLPANYRFCFLEIFVMIKIFQSILQLLPKSHCIKSQFKSFC